MLHNALLAQRVVSILSCRYIADALIGLKNTRIRLFL